MKKEHMKRKKIALQHRISALLLSAVMLITMLPGGALPVKAAGTTVTFYLGDNRPVSFKGGQANGYNINGVYFQVPYSEDNTYIITQTVSTVTSCAISVGNMTASFTLKNVSTNSSMHIGGSSTANVTLDFGSQNYLGGNVGAGILVQQGSTLNITAASSGILNAYGTDYGAGIGGSISVYPGTVNIYGGVVNAIGGAGAAGIGGGYQKSGGTVNVYGGTVTAVGNSFCTGIGAGSGGGSGGTITISGGTVTAENGGSSPAIGASDYGEGGGTVNITGGTVYTNSLAGGDIGGGNVTVNISDNAAVYTRGGNINGTGVKTNISGGTINTNGGNINGTNAEINISGGTVKTDKTSATGGAIGGSNQKITITGGEVITGGGAIGGNDAQVSINAGIINTGGGLIGGDSSKIKISGGSVTTTGSTQDGAILPHTNPASAADYLTISGGTLDCGSGSVGRAGKDITISGGNVKGNLIGTPKNASGATVYKTTVTLPSDGKVDTLPLTRMPDTSVPYGIKDMRTIGGKLYLYLPCPSTTYEVYVSNIQMAGSSTALSYAGPVYRNNNNVLKMSQDELAVTNLPAQHPVGGTLNPGITGGTGTGAVTFSYTGRGGTAYGPSTTPPTAPGDYTVTATKAGGDLYWDRTATMDFSVITIPAITTNSLQNGIRGKAYSQKLEATGPTPAWSLEAGALPPGLTLSSGGVISGTPTTAGTFAFTVKATNAAGSVTQALNITINVLPAITTTSLPIGIRNTFYSHSLEATGTATITWSLEPGSTLPAGLTLSEAGLISGTATEEGTFTFTVRATNTAGYVTKQLSITIAVPPTITTTSLPPVMVNTAYSQTLAATGTASITWSIDSGKLPTGLTLDPSTGVISGTPTAGGTSDFTVKATNAAGSATQSLRIVIRTIPVVTTSTLPDGATGTAYSYTLTATGTRPITWSITDGALPAGLTLDPSTGVISGTPTAGGTFSFTVTATNVAGHGDRTLSITIAIPPTITTTSLPAVMVNTPYSQTLMATGTAPITWSIDSGKLPAGLKLNSEIGVISGTPTAGGTSDFTVKATNAAGSATQSLRIVIRTVPVITTISLPDGATGTAYSYRLTSTGTRPITWSVVSGSGSLPAGLALDPSTGVISGTPTAGGTFSFTVKAANVAGYDTQAFSINVSSVINVSVTWGSMEFTYSDGTWNPETHTYEGGGWQFAENANKISVTSTSNVPVTVSYSYTKEPGFTAVDGSFTNGTNPVTSSSLPAGNAVPQSCNVFLVLSGKPPEIDNSKIGSVTVMITG